jgi:hypothetical protein
MNQTSDIQKELEAISPELAHILPEKKHPDLPHPDFFETFPKRMLEDIKKQHPPAVYPLFSRYTRVAIAAAITGFIILAVYLSESEGAAPDILNVHTELASVPSDELSQFLSDPETEGLPATFTQELKKIPTHELEIFYYENNF